MKHKAKQKKISGKIWVAKKKATHQAGWESIYPLILRLYTQTKFSMEQEKYEDG